MIISKSRRYSKIYYCLLFVCVFLACMVPRYMGTFKIHVGINISLYTVAVAITWLIMSRRLRFYLRIESYIFYIWFLFVLLSLWRAERLGVWAYYLDWTLTAILFMQILYKGHNLRIYDTAIKAMTVALVIHLAMGIYEVTYHRYLFQVGEFSRRYYGTTAISIFFNPNDYVTFVVTVFPFVIYQWSNSKVKILKAVYLLIAAVSIYLIIKSESRGAFFSLILLGISLLILQFRKSRMNKVVFTAVTLSVLLLVGAVTPLRDRLIQVFAFNKVDINGMDTSRVNLIKNGFYFLKQTHGFGVGAGNLVMWLTERSIYRIGRLGFMHNWYMEVLVTFGVSFFALYVCWHLKIIFRLIKMYDRFDRIWNLNNSFLVSFLGFSVVSISSSSNIYSEWIWMYLVLISTFCLFEGKNSREHISYQR